ncbi:MAG: tetraacyldisaccharide 4'-kinase [Candidatus Cloacimonetes bacterium]|jgi:tetraacyldisaccharide 4'-kinase|nr:tetraacyldisaccharide 4'-kinase [Candidatus Cloacimonadota bacterium]MBT6993635.1 tetraacyldisaccharide 4'-kinase [Candidatus Cloacimonadota bacterium]MBT7470090.1 tetraacyldisaccharide 4'-kinase [Candidatus Cloacimonadota bacterium]
MQNLIERHLLNRSLLSYLLLPLAWKFSFLQIIRRKIIFPKFKAKCKIISVGNIVSGGSGKTPVTIYLAKYFITKRKKVAISHRGYKGEFEKTVRIISDREQIFDFAKDAGDEPFLLAEKLPNIPVVAGKNRQKSIELLLAKFPDLDYIILDDSFQNLKVKKDLDFIVFNSITKLGNGFVLPAGFLREPLSALKYADYIIYNGDGEIPTQITKYKKPTLRTKYDVKNFTNQNGNNILKSDLQNKRIALLSAIGTPKSFEKTILNCGLRFEKHYAFPDHYDYQKLKISEYDYVLTTEKDFAKLRFIKHHLPLVVVEVELKFKEDFQL